MATFEQLPGSLGLAFRKGDVFSAEIDFNPISLVGSTVAASVVSTVGGGTVATIHTQVLDAAAGRLNISMTGQQTSVMAPGTYRWSLTANDGVATRTYLAGFVEVA